MFLFVLISSLLFCLINGKQTAVPVKEGENVTLPCNASSEPLALKVVWTHGEHGEKTVAIHSPTGRDLEKQGKQFQGRVSFFNEEINKENLSIQLTNVTKTDAGIYTCYVTYDDQSQKNITVLLVVQTTPQSTMKPPETRTTYKITWIVVFFFGAVVFFVTLNIVLSRWKPQKLNLQPGEDVSLIDMGEHRDPNLNKYHITSYLPGSEKFDGQEPDRDEGERDNNDPNGSEDSPLTESCVHSISMEENPNPNKFPNLPGVTVKEGETATLPFYVDTEFLLQKFKVVWRHGEHSEKTVFNEQQSERCSQDQQFQSRVSVVKEENDKGKRSLKLTNVSQTDAGNYIFWGTYDGHPEPIKLCSVHLEVQEGEKQEEPTGPDTTMKPPETH